VMSLSYGIKTPRKDVEIPMEGTQVDVMGFREWWYMVGKWKRMG
jgi:hypothetical protein